MSVLSLRSEKLIGVGEGGAILSTDTALVDKARWWCSRAYTKTDRVWLRYKNDAVGFNCRMPELLAAVGSAVADDFPRILSRKREIHSWYLEYLSNDPRVAFQQVSDSALPVYWITAVVLVVHAESVGTALMKRFPEVEIRPGFYPLHLQDSFMANSLPCPNAEFLFNHILCLPSSINLSREDVAYVCNSLLLVLDNF